MYKYKFILNFLRLVLVVASLCTILLPKSIAHAPHRVKFQLSKPYININLEVNTGFSSSSSASATPTSTALFLPLSPMTTQTPAILTWSPPHCGDATHGCGNYYITESGQGHQFLGPDILDVSKDWRVHLPAHRPQVGGIDIDGGHNVIIIGGEIDLTTPCKTDNDVCHGINISRNASARGEVYIEGVLIKNPDTTHTKYTGDGIDVNTSTTSNITLQNIRVEGVDGCDANGNSAHADVFQPYGATNSVLHVDHLTGTSDFQGMEVPPDLTSPRSGTYKNVNMDMLSNSHSGCKSSSHYGWWLAKDANTCTMYPTSLLNTYEKEPSGSLASNAVWPDKNITFGCPANYSNGKATWPTIANISGSITNGFPPGGDFVPSGVAGISYVSPGYQTS